MDQKQAYRLRAAKLQELKDATNIDANSMFDVIDEATMHMVDNFKPAIGPQYKRDYCFIMGTTFLGTDVRDPAQDIHARAAFFHGDLHEWSHDLAEIMTQDEEVCAMVFHCVQIYAQLLIKKQGGHSEKNS